MGEAPVLGLLQLETWAPSTGFRHGLTWGERVGGDTGPSPAAFWLGLLLIQHLPGLGLPLCHGENTCVLGSHRGGVA